MIPNTGGRTDTVQYNGDWLLERFAWAAEQTTLPGF